MTSSFCRLWLAAVVATLTGCAGAAWQPGGPSQPTSDWKSVYVTDADLMVRIPPAFEQRNSSGCYQDRTRLFDEPLYGPSWLDVCIRTVHGGEEVPSFEAIDRRTRAADSCFDCMTYDQIKSYQTRLGEHDAKVQLALGTGGINGKHRVPEMIVELAVGQDLVVLHGEFGDPSGGETLLGIAGSVSAP